MQLPPLKLVSNFKLVGMRLTPGTVIHKSMVFRPETPHNDRPYFTSMITSTPGDMVQMFNCSLALEENCRSSSAPMICNPATSTHPSLSPKDYINANPVNRQSRVLCRHDTLPDAAGPVALLHPPRWSLRIRSWGGGGP